MTTDLLPNLAKTNVDWLGESVERQSHQQPASWRDFGAACRIIAHLFTVLLESVQEQLRTGAESRALLNTARASAHVAELALERLGKLQGLQGASVISADIDKGIAAANQVRELMTAVVAVASAPDPAPVREEVLAGAEAGPFTRLDKPR
jgi:hypothetical protein